MKEVIAVILSVILLMFAIIYIANGFTTNRSCSKETAIYTKKFYGLTLTKEVKEKDVYCRNY